MTTDNSDRKKEEWMNSKWRPMMGWLYMFICLMDMAIFPILWSLLQAAMKQPVTQWSPLTLQGAGLFHVAMGAVLGIAAFGRTQEKLAGANNGGAQPPTQPTTFGAASPAPSGFSAPTTPSFGATSPANSFGGSSFGNTPAAPTVASSGKPGPVQPPQPEL